MSSPLLVNHLFNAFADETRLRILHLLMRGELCVCDIHETLRLPQSKVSRHLAYLRRAGLVEVRKEGLWKHYALARAEGKFHRSLLGCVKSCFHEVAILEQDLDTLGKRLKTKVC